MVRGVTGRLPGLVVGAGLALGAFVGAANLPEAAAQDRRGQADPAGGLVDLRAEVAARLAWAQDPARFFAGDPAAELRRHFEALWTLSPERVDPRSLDDDPEALMRQVFALMLALDDRLAEAAAREALTQELADAKRRGLRGARFLREAALLRALERQPDALYRGGRPVLADRFPKHHWLVHPAWATRPFDDYPRAYSILCVGRSVVSAAIARSAAEDNQFSHYALAYRCKEPQALRGETYPAGTWFVIESLIETGVTIRLLDEHYDSTARDVIFVLRDETKQPALDAAADAFFARARDAIAAGRPLAYDFSMGTAGGTNGGAATSGVVGALGGEAGGPAAPAPPRELQSFFCSGVGEEVYRRAGIELFGPRTRFNAGAGSRALFRSWGVDPSAPGPAPGDADVSPELLRVAEGSVAAELPASHRMHAVLASMFRWMDEDGYAPRTPWWFRPTSAVLVRLSGTPFNFADVPEGMSKDALRAFYAIDKAAQAYARRLEAEDAAFRARTGRNMTPPELEAALLAFRDDVSEVKSWFKRFPRAVGVWSLETTTTLFGRTPLRLTIREGAGGDLEVVREVLDRGGATKARAVGQGTPREGKVDVRFPAGSSAPERITYVLKDGGKIVGDVPGHARVEAGRRAGD